VNTVAGYLGVAGFAWLTLFQLGLVAGLPYGRMSWGGTHRVLPGRLRVASLFSAVLAVLGGLAVGQASGLGPDILPGVVVRPLLGALAALFALSFVGNAASKSRIERLHGVPLTIILVGSCAVLAFSGGA
jgi:hypothetical protein